MAGPADDAPARPLFVVLDGVDGCGKSTQAARLTASLSALRGEHAEGALHLREPGSTAAGERIRELVLSPETELGRGGLVLLFAAARREMLERLVAPALEAGRDVVVERFHASTFAYQGRAGRDAPEPGGLDFDDDALLALLRQWAGWPAPTLEIVLDLDPQTAHARALERSGDAGDRFERRGLVFQERVRDGMREYLRRTPRALALDATGSEAEVAERILEAVLARAQGAARA